MIFNGHRTIDYESCIAFYLDALHPAKSSAVEAWLHMHPEIARRARRDAEAQEQLKRHFDRVLEEPVPPRLLRAGRATRPRWPMRAGLAALIAVSALGGWWLGTFRADQASTQWALFSRHVARLTQRQTPRHPVSVAGDAVSVPHPDLSMQGYALVASRRLRKGKQQLVEFLYRDNQGQQVKVYARPRSARSQQRPSLYLHSGARLARWRHDGVNYALTGDMPPAALKALAQAAVEGKSLSPSPHNATKDTAPKQSSPPSYRPGQPAVIPASDSSAPS